MKQARHTATFLSGILHGVAIGAFAATLFIWWVSRGEMRGAIESYAWFVIVVSALPATIFDAFVASARAIRKWNHPTSGAEKP